MSRYLLLQLITVARIPLAIVIVVVLLTLQHTTQVIVTCAVVLAIGELTDFLDGFLARRWKLQSELGAMLDPYADSISRIIIFWGLACVELSLAIVPLVMALRDVTVSYCRIYWAMKGKSVSARWSGKVKAVVQCIAAFALLFLPLYPEAYRGNTLLIFSWTTIVVTAYSGIDYFRASLQVSRDAE